MKLFISTLLVCLLFGCETIEKKADKIGKKEIKEISKFLQQPESELRVEMGEPDEIVHDDKGSKFFVYKKKKYGIICEKKFEIDKNKMIVAVSSRGCF
jgi:mRNA-degrading endonuclease RelE of RelBE toxin-antitoxin system